MLCTLYYIKEEIVCKNLFKKYHNLLPSPAVLSACTITLGMNCVDESSLVSTVTFEGALSGTEPTAPSDQ